MKRTILSFLFVIFLNLAGACTTVGTIPKAGNTPAQIPIETGEVSDPYHICTSVTEIPAGECEALVAFYLRTDGPSWTMNKEEWANNDLWLATNTPCYWAGVRCNNGHITEITLYFNGLSGEIPAEIGDLSHLTELDVSDNNLSHAPPEIGSLTNLTELNLAFNALSDLPAEIGHLTNLKWLSLAGNALTRVPEIGSLTDLTELNLAENNLSSVPSEIGNLNNLTRLDLYQNKLNSLPPEIGKLHNLEYLRLKNNNLNKLPAEIGNLTNLTELDLSENQLTGLPLEVGKTTKLVYLYLSNNSIASLPPEIGNLTKLSELYLDGNNLSNVPAEIGNLTSLNYLLLSNNSLRSVPPEIGNLTGLTLLYLDGNHLSTLPPEIRNLTNLSELWLAGNDLASLPPDLCVVFAKVVIPQSLCKSGVDCTAVERLPNDSVEAQQILEEFIQNFKKEHPTEYMGMAVLDRVDQLGEWAVVQGSVSGDDGNIIVVRQTSQGYQLEEQYLVIPAPDFEEPEKRVTQYFLKKLPDAPPALFTCLEQTWFPGQEARPTKPPHAYQLVYMGTDNGNTDGVTEIHAIPFDGSEPRLLLSAPMMIIDLVLSPDGEQLAFWGCPGAIAYDCIPPEEDLDVWAVNWDGSNLRNLTENSAANDAHPSWSPHGEQLVFDSDRSGIPQLFIMNADGGNPRAITDDSLRNTEPKWSPDGKWIAYHCSQGINNRICVVSPDGEPAGESIEGTEPVWSPAGVESVQLAFLCFQDLQSDTCTARPDSSDRINLTNYRADEHSPAWSPDGNWLAFVSNRGDDVDVYKICVTCPGEPMAIRLTDKPSTAGWPTWSPDGSRVGYVSAETLMLVNADRSDATYLASGVFGPPIWKP
jgi:leucine-rich repeat protein SHOC2